MQLETQRLILRPFTEADYDDLYAFLAPLRDNEFEGYPGITYENGRTHLEYRLNAEEFVAIQMKDTGKVIGNVYCGQRDFQSREIGYIVHQQYQRMGIAYEALSAVIA